MADAAQKVVAAGGREGKESGKTERDMSILIDKNTRVITQGITGKTGQFHTADEPRYANGKNCYVAGVNPKKAGEDFEGIPIFGTVKEAKQADRRQRLGDLRAAAVCRRGDRRGGRRGPRPRDLHHRGHPGARHGPHQATACRASATRLVGPELPGRDHARRDQDRHHAGPHPQARAASAWCRARARSPTRRWAS